MNTMYVDDVFVVDLVPVVQRRIPGLAGRTHGTWTDEQLQLLVYLRDTKRKEWHEIGRVMQRPWKTCHSRYAAIKSVEKRAEPKPQPLSAETPKPYRLHEELGISTYSVCRSTQISVPRVGGFTYVDKVMSITLSGGHK